MALKRNASGRLVRNAMGRLVRCGGAPTHCIPAALIYSAVQVTVSGVIRCDGGTPWPTATGTFVGFSGNTTCCYFPAGIDQAFNEPVTGQPMTLSVQVHYSINPSTGAPTHWFVISMGRNRGFGLPAAIHFHASWPCPRDDMCFPSTLVPIDNENLAGQCFATVTRTGSGPGLCGLSGQHLIRAHSGTAQLSFIV